MPAQPENAVIYDVFISYSRSDSEWVYSFRLDSMNPVDSL